MKLPGSLSLPTLAGVLAGSVAIGGVAVPGAIYLAQSHRPITQYSQVVATETVTVVPDPIVVTEIETVRAPAEVRTVREVVTEATTLAPQVETVTESRAPRRTVCRQVYTDAGLSGRPPETHCQEE